MIRTEYLVVGCILAVFGLGLSFVGYQKTQPTIADTAVGLIEQLSKQRAPQGVKSDKTQGYVFMGVGGVAFLAGIGMVMTSRTKPTGRDDTPWP